MRFTMMVLMAVVTTLATTPALHALGPDHRLRYNPRLRQGDGGQAHTR